jgi:hypothetical protein
MGGGGGSSTDSQTYTNLIPTYIPNFQDWAVGYLNDALSLSASNFKPYTGSTYATQNVNETNGIAALVTRGTNGDTIEIDGETYLRSLHTDGYIGINPRLDVAFSKIVEEFLQKMNEEDLPTIQTSHAFAFGGSEHNIAEAKLAERVMENINLASEKIYYDDFRLERKLQDSGLSHAIPYGQRTLRDAEILRQAGIYGREFLQGYYKDQWDIWNENEILPLRNLDILGNAVRSVIGTTRTTSTAYYKPSAFNDIAGSALTGLSIYKLFKDTTLNPYTNLPIKEP